MAPVKGKKSPNGKTPSRTANTKSKPGLKKKAGGPPPSQQKTKSAKTLLNKKPQKKQYTAEQLGVPTLNTITPVGVQKPRGKKKGKIFVDDPNTMQTIMAIVNAETEGKIESKMLRARQMEEIREARQKEAEAKEQSKKDAIETKKEELRKNRRKGKFATTDVEDKPLPHGNKKKRVSFG